jgi:hypothetical protein
VFLVIYIFYKQAMQCIKESYTVELVQSDR